MLGEHLKLFTDKVESIGPNGGAIQENITVRFVGADGKSWTGSAARLETEQCD